MIARSHRFHGYTALRHVYAYGRTVRGRYMSVRYSQNPRRSSYRAAVVVSRKVHKSAVVRNRIRRRIYEAIRLQEPDITQPFDIIVTVFTTQVAVLPASELQAAVRQHLEQAGIVTRREAGPARDIVEPKEHL